jgi:hypothetical protein
MAINLYNSTWEKAAVKKDDDILLETSHIIILGNEGNHKEHCIEKIIEHEKKKNVIHIGLKQDFLYYYNNNKDLYELRDIHHIDNLESNKNYFITHSLIDFDMHEICELFDILEDNYLIIFESITCCDKEKDYYSLIKKSLEKFSFVILSQSYLAEHEESKNIIPYLDTIILKRNFSCIDALVFDETKLGELNNDEYILFKKVD